jgi:hypothetical protein
MHWKKLRFALLGLLSVCLVFWSGIAFAQDGSHDVQLVKIGGDAVVTENQTVEQAIAIGGNLTIQTGGYVTEQAVAIGGNITLEPDARVDGQVVAIGGTITREEGALIGGQEVELFAGLQGILNRFGVFGTMYLVNVSVLILSLVVVIIFGVFLLLLLPGHLQSIASTISQHPFKSGMWGLGGLIVAALVTALLAGSILGVLLIPIVNLIVAIAGIVGCTATGLWIGEKTTARPSSLLIKEFLIGVLILALITLIPIVGGLLALMVSLFGFGAVLLSRFGVLQPSNIEKTFDQLEGTARSEG